MIRCTALTRTPASADQAEIAPPRASPTPMDIQRNQMGNDLTTVLRPVKLRLCCAFAGSSSKPPS
jgi:hypothetical protein